MLHCEDSSLEKIAAEVGTPAYVYSGKSFDDAYARADRAMSFGPHVIAFAVKANGNLGILSRLAKLGAAADVVSGGEITRALKAGVPASRIFFNGGGKTDAEIVQALDTQVRSIHVDGLPELDVVETIARQRNAVAPIVLRVNPDVDAATHPYIATGLKTSKFGVDLDTARSTLKRIVASPHLKLDGVACHIGSQLMTAAPMRDAAEIVARFCVECRQAGATLRTFDAGGGWPIVYGDEDTQVPSFDAFGAAIAEGLRAGGASELGLEVVVELGRALVGDAGVLLTRVLYIKDQGEKRFVIVDGAMTELLRPALYNAYHHIEPVRTRAGGTRAVDVVGPVCETGDFFAEGRALPELQRGDLLVLHSAGAYGASMGSTYNGRPRAPEVIVDGARTKIVRRRETVDELFALEGI